jgi:hypothetical protein
LKLNFSFESIVYRKSDALLEAKFDETVRGGMPVDLELQKRVYCALTVKKPVLELMQSLEVSKIQLVPIIFNLVILDLVALEPAITASDTHIQTVQSLDAYETGRPPNVESFESDADWHKVKAKAEILAPSTAFDSQTMDFVQEIKVLTNLNRVSQHAVKESFKIRKMRPVSSFRRFFQPALVLLAIILTCLYLQAFQTHNTKRPSRASASLSAKGQHASKRSAF